MASLIDKIIGGVSPKTAFNRARFRMAAQVLDQHTRKYDAAARTRRTEGWHPVGGTSANTETMAQLGILRERSRERVRNDAHGKRAVQAIRNNAIGTGIKPTPFMIKKNQAILDKIKDAWWKWAETPACDFDGRETFVGLQSLVMSTVVESGECIVRKRRLKSKKGILPIQIQVCEPDFIDSSKENPTTEGGGWIIQGVEFDRDGKRKAIWLFDRHPSDYGVNLESKPVPFSDVLHIYLAERPGQVRGVPWMSSVMLRMKDFDEYQDAQLIHQKVAACFTAFVHDNNMQEGIAGMNPAQVQDEKDKLSKVEPGIIEYLEPGKTVTFGTPPPVEGYEPYTRKTLQGIAAGLGISYEALTGDLSSTNFSSGRMGWLEFHRNITEWQNRVMIPGFCDPIWSWFITALQIKGIIPDSTEVVADWTPPKREMIDPMKEIQGLALEVKNNFRSWQDAVRQKGFDPDTLMAQIAEDQKRFAEHDLAWPGSLPSGPQTNTNTK